MNTMKYCTKENLLAERFQSIWIIFTSFVDYLPGWAYGRNGSIFQTTSVECPEGEEKEQVDPSDNSFYGWSRHIGRYDYTAILGGDNFVCQGGLRHIFTILKTRFSSGEWGFRLLRSAHNVNYWSIQWHVFIYCFSMTSPVYMYVFLLNYVTISISLFFWQTEKHLSVRESFGAVVPPCFWRADLE